MNSFWNLEKEKHKEFECLIGDINADVCIIGAGLTGLSTAYYLSQKGKRVVILEKDRIVSGTSGGTTGKITSQHDLIYKYLKDEHGKEVAQKYAKSNELAIENIEKIIKKENIECDFEKKSAFVYTKDEKEVEKIKKEVKIAKELGIDAEFVTNIDLPIDILGAIEFKNQAQFHPAKYAYGLVNCILKNKGIIYENSKVVEIDQEDEAGYVICTKSGTVRTKYVLIATRYPIINFPGYYFLKMYQSMSYAMIFDMPKEFDINGMYISSEVPKNSFRSVKYGDKNLLLAVGYDHKTGDEIIGNPFEYLEKRVKNIYPEAKKMYWWSAEDCISLDKIPYIGDFSKIMDNVYVATGFKKWGMTFSNISANIITDRILEIENDYEETYKSSRLEMIKNKDETINMLKDSAEGIVVKRIKNKITPTCTHLGCKLTWNDIEETWDCLCHGSRFTKDGEVFEGPAIDDLDED